jgi:hypothetical protein
MSLPSPSNLRRTVTSSASATVEWDAPTGPYIESGKQFNRIGYKRQIVTNGINGTIATNAVSSPYILTLSPNTTYVIRVWAKYQGTTDLADVRDSLPAEVSLSTYPPNPPSNVSIEAGNQQLTIRWDASTGTAATSYKIYDASDNLITTNMTIDQANRTAVHTSLTNGSRYGYKIAGVSAVNFEGSKSSPVYGVPADTSALESTVSTIIIPQAGGNIAAALPSINSLLNSLTTDLQKNNVAATTTQAAAENAITANASASTATKITNIETALTAVATGLPVARATAIADLGVNTIKMDTNLTLPEKIAILAKTANTVGQTSTTLKTAFVSDIMSVGEFTDAPIALNADQTAALFSSHPNISNPPSVVDVVVPPTNATSVTLSSSAAQYILMEPNSTLSFTFGGTSKTFTYNATNGTLVDSNSNVYVNGDLISIGSANLRIYAIGGAGLTPVSEPGAPASIDVTPDANNSALIDWTPPTNTGGIPLTGYFVKYTIGGTTTDVFVGEDQTSYSFIGLANGTYTFEVVAANAIGQGPSASVSNVQIGTATPPSVPCFPAGVMIRTPGGEKAVETLKTGDLVVTAAGRVVPIRMHSYSLEATTVATAPYFIPANALGPKAPAKPLHLSPLHAFQVRPNVWWCAQQAAKVSSKIQQYAVGESITYYHVECPNFLRDNLVADGVVVESFAGKQLTAAESRNLYKFNKEVGGYVRSAHARAVVGTVL